MTLLKDWIREPDYAAEFRLPELIDWINRRPLAEVEQLRASIIEECAKVCEDLRHDDYSAETPEWFGATFDCARAIRALSSALPSHQGNCK